MIVTRTPLRVSLFGGGSDIPAFYEREPGAVLSMTINKYVYIAAHNVPANHIKLMYSEIEQVSTVSEIKHELVKACLEHFNHPGSIEIASFADIPTKGTGLGSSSSFTVGLINVLTHGALEPDLLAELACRVEIELCGKRIGKQDQYAAALGGFNFFEFDKEGVHTTYAPLGDELTQRLFLINTGITRSADSILATQVECLKNQTGNVFEITKLIREHAYEAYRYLNDDNLDEIGYMLDRTWAMKQELSPWVSTPEIDKLYSKIKQAGAYGGKLLGAGGGGYILAYVPLKQQQAFLSKFPAEQMLPFEFEPLGSTLLVDDTAF